MLGSGYGLRWRRRRLMSHCDAVNFSLPVWILCFALRAFDTYQALFSCCCESLTGNYLDGSCLRWHILCATLSSEYFKNSTLYKWLSLVRLDLVQRLRLWALFSQNISEYEIVVVWGFEVISSNVGYEEIDKSRLESVSKECWINSVGWLVVDLERCSGSEERRFKHYSLLISD